MGEGGRDKRKSGRRGRQRVREETVKGESEMSKTENEKRER